MRNKKLKIAGIVAISCLMLAIPFIVRRPQKKADLPSVRELLFPHAYERMAETEKRFAENMAGDNLLSVVSNLDGSTPSVFVELMMEKEKDLVGVLYIPSVSLEPTPLYRFHEYYELQKIADAENSAGAYAMYSWRDKSVHRVEFGDHNYQNFRVNENITVGDVGYVNMGDRVLRMVCVSASVEDISDYNKSVINDNKKITTITCNGYQRTVHRWEITENSDVTFDELYEIVGKYYKGQRDSTYSSGPQ